MKAILNLLWATLGMMFVLVICIFLGVMFSLSWILGIPIEVKGKNGKKLGYYRWFKFYRA